MFSGIIQGVGRIASATAQGGGLRLVVDVGDLDIADVGEGDSVAVAGCCLTVVAVAERALSFDVSAETLACTTGLDRPGEVNLEKALRLSDRLGGHLVSGHVDGVGVVIRLETVEGEQGSRVLEIDAPTALERFIAAKGSVAVDGVSLTVNEVAGSRFTVNLIPHTLRVTTFGRRKSGDRVNLEIDLVARYVERLLSSGS
jgi:riboflavin synthase